MGFKIFVQYYFLFLKSHVTFSVASSKTIFCTYKVNLPLYDCSNEQADKKHKSWFRGEILEFAKSLVVKVGCIYKWVITPF